MGFPYKYKILRPAAFSNLGAHLLKYVNTTDRVSAVDCLYYCFYSLLSESQSGPEIRADSCVKIRNGTAHIYPLLLRLLKFCDSNDQPIIHLWSTYLHKMTCCLTSLIIINGMRWTGKRLVIINHECYDIPIYQETVVWKRMCWQWTTLSLLTCGHAAAKEKWRWPRPIPV